MQSAIVKIDQAIESLKEQATVLVEEVRQILKSKALRPQKQNPGDAHRKKTKALWVYLRERAGYGTISIVWSQVMYFHQQTQRPFLKDIARGRGFQIPQGKFMVYARGYHPDVQDGLWGYEKTFGEIRRRQTLLSKARSNLMEYQKRAAIPISGE